MYHKIGTSSYTGIVTVTINRMGHACSVAASVCNFYPSYVDMMC